MLLQVKYKLKYAQDAISYLTKAEIPVTMGVSRNVATS